MLLQMRIHYRNPAFFACHDPIRQYALTSFRDPRGSTFTQAIVWERVRAGWPLDTNYLIP